MYLGSAVLGGHLVLGRSVRGTRSPRTSCPGGHVRGGDMSFYDNGTSYAMLLAETNQWLSYKYLIHIITTLELTFVQV